MAAEYREHFTFEEDKEEIDAVEIVDIPGCFVLHGYDIVIRYPTGDEWCFAIGGWKDKQIVTLSTEQLEILEKWEIPVQPNIKTAR